MANVGSNAKPLEIVYFDMKNKLTRRFSFCRRCHSIRLSSSGFTVNGKCYLCLRDAADDEEEEAHLA